MDKLRNRQRLKEQDSIHQLPLLLIRIILVHMVTLCDKPTNAVSSVHHMLAIIVMLEALQWYKQPIEI